MGVANVILGFIVILAVVIGSVFAMNYYQKQSTVSDTYGNTPTLQNNVTTNMVVNGTSTGTRAEGGLLIFVAVLCVLAVIAYFAFNKR